MDTQRGSREGGGGEAVAVIWARVNGSADPVVTGETEVSGHARDTLYRKHPQAWQMEWLWEVSGDKN